MDLVKAADTTHGDGPLGAIYETVGWGIKEENLPLGTL